MERNSNGIASRLSRKPNLWWGAILGAVIGLISFAPVWIHHGGQYMEYGDYFLQYIPFIKELKRMVLSGNMAYSWNSFLGDNFIGAYSYYTIFNPFAWFVALFPDEHILYATMFSILLKLAISMVSAMLYLRLFCKKDIYAVIGAFLYTFSGFTLVNTSFYFFLDVIAIFPFLLYGLELLMQERKRWVYIMALCLNAAINYYFFVSSVLFVVIYVIFRLELYKPAAWRRHWRTFLHIAGCSIVGTGLAGIALVPSFFAILGSGKATETIGTKLLLMYWPQNILERLRTFVAPIESGRYHAFFDCSTWSSTGMYLPLFGCYGVILWCIRKKDWLKKVCVFLTICYFVPVLNAAFNLFSSTDYTRWLYGMVLLFSLATILTLEEIEEGHQTFHSKLLLGLTSFTAALLLLPTAVYFLYRQGISLVNRFCSACETEFFMGCDAIIIMLILTAANYMGLWYITKQKKFSAKRICCFVVGACVINFCVYNAINYDLHAIEYSNDYYYKKALTEGQESGETTFTYRIDHPSQIENYGLFKNIPSVNYYNSLQNPSSSRFAAAVGIGDDVKDTILVSPQEGSEYTDALLSVKYYLDYDGNAAIPEGFQYLQTENNVAIYENENYIPMGFVYDSYCLEEQMGDLRPEERAKGLLSTLVIQSADEDKVSGLLERYAGPGGTVNFQNEVSERRETTCSLFSGTSEGFHAEISLKQENIVFFSIPNDSNWEITVNGSPVQAIEVNYGLLGIHCDAGENVITGRYHVRGVTAGIVCTAGSLVVWLAVALRSKKKKLGVSTHAFRNHPGLQ